MDKTKGKGALEAYSEREDPDQTAHERSLIRAFTVCLQIYWTVDGTNGQVGLGGSFGCASEWRSGGRGFDPHRVRQHSFVEINHETVNNHSLPSADSRSTVGSSW